MFTATKLKEEHDKDIQKLNMDQNEHLLNEIKKLDKILADFQKLTEKLAELEPEHIK